MLFQFIVMIFMFLALFMADSVPLYVNRRSLSFQKVILLFLILEIYIAVLILVRRDLITELLMFLQRFLKNMFLSLLDRRLCLPFLKM